MTRGPTTSLYTNSISLPELFGTEKKKVQNKQWVSDCAIVSKLLPENYVPKQQTYYSRNFIKEMGDWMGNYVQYR